MAPPATMATRPRKQKQKQKQREGGLLAALSTFVVLLVLVFLHAGGVAAAVQGLAFHVSGPRGWRVPDANTSYGWWAMNNRFHVGDSLYFKYGGGDSVLVVDREAFDGCNATEPLASFTDGATTVRLDRPGFFCFISGAPGHCEEGQKLVVRVMVHPPEDAASPARGPALPPATSQPGHGGSGSGSGARSGPPGASSGAAAVAAGAALAAATAVLVGLALLLP
ncbi:early nodulin-like protein 1 [Oryza brachyantha]|uniref:early nodulin-like protein 1 n=1 Tax=Oryza brachyantha TaxID=4533 RepID=UPI001ADA8A81|nr:early nodulin-like protein 1 [Oryza brachyantha]